MANIFNFFILFLGLATVWVGVAAVVQKRSVKRDAHDQRSTNAAS
jgi:hypothetical protein